MKTRLNSTKHSDALYWLLALIFGAACGYVHILVRDSSLSVLMVTGFTMFLAYCRPERVWRWVLVMGLSMPVAALIALLARERPSHGMIAGTFAGLAFSIVSAVGGRVLRRARSVLFPPKETSETEATSVPPRN
jgi:Na+/proline symporter